MPRWGVVGGSPAATRRPARGDKPWPPEVGPAGTCVESCQDHCWEGRIRQEMRGLGGSTTCLYRVASLGRGAAKMVENDWISNIYYKGSTLSMPLLQDKPAELLTTCLLTLPCTPWFPQKK